jgi:TPR repeat protein
MQFAFKFYKRAAELECKEAIYKLGYFFENGIETEKNIDLAMRKYDAVASDNYELAMNALGTLFHSEAYKDYS